MILGKLNDFNAMSGIMSDSLDSADRGDPSQLVCIIQTIDFHKKTDFCNCCKVIGSLIKQLEK